MFNVEAFTNVIVAGTSLLTAGAIVVQARRVDLHEHRLVPVLTLFFVLLSADRLAGPRGPFDYSYAIDVATDVGMVLCLAIVLTEVPALVSAIKGAVDDARVRQEEYDRALAHYTQLVRHRVMNPLTVISGAAETIRAGLADEPALRDQLCGAIIDGAGEIERIALEPERRGAEERELDAVPRVPERRTQLPPGPT
jgi:signal transduction histidine kinase